MRKLLSLFFLTTSLLQAQNLPLNDKGKVAFEGVVRLDSMKANVLYTNTLRWILESNYKIMEKDSAGGKLLASQTFGVYDKGYVTKKLHGKITYTLTVDVKNGKYRYSFSDFVFAYYKEDRTSHFVPTGKKKPLEDPVAQGWQNLWENHKKNTQKIIESQADQLRIAMLFNPKQVSKQTTKKEEW